MIAILTRSSAIADKSRVLVCIVVGDIAGLFVRMCRQEVHVHMLQTAN